MGADRQPATVRAPDEQHACYRPSGQLSEVRWMHLSVAALGAGLLGGVLTALLTVAASSSTEWFPASWVTGVLVPLGVLAWVARRLNRAGKTPTQKTPAYLPAGAMAVAFGAAASLLCWRARGKWTGPTSTWRRWCDGHFRRCYGWNGRPGDIGSCRGNLSESADGTARADQPGRCSHAGGLGGRPAHVRSRRWIAFVFGQPLVVFPAVAMAVTTALRAARHSLS